MATKNGNRDPGIGAALKAAPFRFDFFQAVRLIKLFHLKRFGRETRNIPIHYRTRLTLEFPASAIHDLTLPVPAPMPGEPVAGPAGADASPVTVPDPVPGTTTDPVTMMVNFMGLTGPLGVLPRHYTELLISRRLMYRDTSAHAFLDLFNDRMIELFYRAWSKYNFYVAMERGESDGFSHHLLDIVGLGTRQLQGRLRVTDRGLDDESIVYYSGLFAQRPISAAALHRIFSDYLGCQVAVEQCRGRWLRLSPDDRTRLGGGAALGVDTVLGDRVWDRQSLLRFRVGPLTRRQFERFLPDGPDHAVFVAVARYLLGIGLDFDLQLVLRKEEVPPCRLAPGQGARLGWNSWIGLKPHTRNPDQAVLPCDRELRH